MTIQLISTDQVDSLPDGIDGFLGLEEICRQRLNEAERDLRDGEYLTSWRLAYMGSVSAAAFEYGVDPERGLNPRNFVSHFNNTTDYDFAGFDNEVRAITTSLQITGARERSPPLAARSTARQP